MLNVKDLRANYGRIPILNGISFDVDEGEVVGVLGHNGMGKTTLMKTLMGFVAAVGGHIHFEGEDVTQESPDARSRRGLGYVPQGRQIYPRLSVRDNLRIGAIAGGGPVEGVVEAILEDFSRLKSLLDRMGGTLSGGEQQILAIARCLCADPRLILLDEPTEGIQPSIIDQIFENLARLQASRRLTMVVVEQNLEFVAALSQRVLVIQKGQIIEELRDPSLLSGSSLFGEIVGFDG